MQSRLLAVTLAAACSTGAACAAPAEAAVDTAAPPSVIKVVFVIAMENQDARDIYGNTTSAPYINNVLLPTYAHSTNFTDELPPAIPSEPHYVWMEAGTNQFSDHTFTGDGDATAVNSTASKLHLATQIRKAGLTWMAYQEGINATTGACPISSSGHYAAKHDPFVFFQDVSGSPPSKTTKGCAARHKDTSALAADLANHAVASYNFITPNLCNDMHGDTGCADGNYIRAGDKWLQANLPAIIDYANANAGAIFITWDESESTTYMPFIAIGPHVKAGYAGSVNYTHSAMLRSMEEILQLAPLKTVKSATDFKDLFVAGYFP